ncbi:hypothetical protein TNCV_5118941 [Trichonephila clavipes]|nr:hypothetical protein TNCV_5118941 [Trichonephila clavipes]
MYPVLIAKKVRRQMWERSDRFPNCWEKFCKLVVRNSDHFPTGSPRDEKRRRYKMLSVFHGSVTTVCQEDRTLTIRPDRPRALRGRQTRDKRNKRVPCKVISVQMFLKLEEVLELLNSLHSDESDVEIAVLPPEARELTDEDEGDENEVNTCEIFINDAHGSLDVRNGDSFQSEPSTSPSVSTTKSRKKAKRHQLS